MMKGEGVDYSSDPHKVDGMSGATLTGKGVNNMLVQYLGLYESYLKNLKAPSSNATSSNAEIVESTNDLK